MHFLNMKKTKNKLRKVTLSFEVHSNESACRKSGRLGMEQVYCSFIHINLQYLHMNKYHRNRH